MARIKYFEEVEREHTTVHAPTHCAYSIYAIDGRRFLQLDTFGRVGRKLRGKVSQSVQLDESGARELLTILSRAFPSLR